MQKIIRQIQNETFGAAETEHEIDHCEYAPPGAAYPGDGSVYVEPVVAHHAECAAWMCDYVINPDY